MSIGRFGAVVTACLLMIGCALAQDTGPEDRTLVLTATQATYSIASALSVDTAIEVINIPDDGRELAVLKSWIERRKDRFTSLFSQASAVVSLTNALPTDPLYRYARAANVRIVNIDAAVPWVYDTPGVALTDTPVSNVDWAANAQTGGAEAATSPYFWLSISNVMRMADIVANDLSALFPAFAPTIAVNLDQFRRSILSMRNSYQTRLLAAASDTVFALTGDFVYLTNDLGLFVDSYFIKQDINWTADDLGALTDHLEQRDIGVVIHKWMPSDAIQAAISAAGAQLVVLENGDQGRLDSDDVLARDGLQQILSSNLEQLTTALEGHE